jgi:hypothetical protein
MEKLKALKAFKEIVETKELKKRYDSFIPLQAKKTLPTMRLKCPEKELTGVEPSMTEICATLSSLTYKDNLLEKFTFKFDASKVDATSDYHIPLKSTTPTFITATIEKTLILCWRGSVTLMDWVVDFAAAPVASPLLRQMARYIKVHCGYFSLVENDLALHEDRIIEEIETKDIKELIMTGHSLGGGMAQVAHFLIQGGHLIK